MLHEDFKLESSVKFLRLVRSNCFQHIEVAKMIVENIDWGWTKFIRDDELIFLLDYKIFLLCKIVFNDFVLLGRAFSPTLEIERIWRYHMHDPRAYMQMSSVIGTIIDHCDEEYDLRRKRRIVRFQRCAQELTGKYLKSTEITLIVID
jgi:hypothetical protein